MTHFVKAWILAIGLILSHANSIVGAGRVAGSAVRRTGSGQRT